MDPVILLNIQTEERKILDPNGNGKGFIGSASFSPKGNLILFGTSKGLVFVIDTKTYKVSVSIILFINSFNVKNRKDKVLQ